MWLNRLFQSNVLFYITQLSFQLSWLSEVLFTNNRHMSCDVLCPVIEMYDLLDGSSFVYILVFKNMEKISFLFMKFASGLRSKIIFSSRKWCGQQFCRFVVICWSRGTNVVEYVSLPHSATLPHSTLDCPRPPFSKARV